MSVQWTYHFKKKVETADVAVTYWVDKKDVTLPFKVVVGMGF